MENQKDQTFGVYEKNGGVCSLKAINYRLDITDFTMKKTVIEEFENSRNKPIEMVYKFCDTDENTINFIEVELYDPEKDERRVLKAKVEEKKKAQEKYDDAIADGSSAMLAEKDEDDRVTLSLGNILPKVQITVKMDSVEEVKVEKALTLSNDCTMKIKIPSLNYSGGQYKDAEDNISVECRVKLTNSGKVTKMSSPSHRGAFEVDLESAAIVTTQKVSFNRDIDIEVTVEKAPLVSGLMEQTGEKDFVAAINLVPSFDDDVPVQTELVIIIDCSGSMAGSRMRHAKAAMNGFLDAIYDKSKEHNIKMNLVRFGSRYEALYRAEPKTLNRGSFQEIKDYLESTTSNMGGTDILSPVRHVLSQKVSEGYTRQVFLLTDGEDRNTERIIQYVRKSARTTRFFSFGIGAGINPVLIERVAASSLGRAVFLAQNSEIQEKVMEQLEYALQPAVQDIKVKFPVEAESVTERVPACYNLQKQSLYYFTKAPCDQCQLSYTIAGKKISQAVPLPAHKGGLFLGSVAAKKRVRELETAWGDLGLSQEHAHDQIRGLGMKYHFLTTQTSFLMVAENEDDAIMDDLATESIQAVQRKEEEEEDEPALQPMLDAGRHYQARNNGRQQENLARRAAPARNYGGGGGGGWGNPFSIGGCVDSEARIRVLRGKSEKSEEEEEGEHEEEFVWKKLGEVEQGEYVESMSEKGVLEYSLVIEKVNHQSERSVFIILLEDGRELKLTGSHLIPYSKTRVEEKSKYVNIVAKKVKAGGWILGTGQGGKVSPLRVVSVREGKAMVSIVYTNNTTMVVNDIVCSVFTKQKIFKLFYYYKKLYWNTPKKVRPSVFRKVCDTFTHAVFVNERYVL